jgi:hypothetical protein
LIWCLWNHTYREQKVVGVFVRVFVRRFSLHAGNLPSKRPSQIRGGTKAAVWLGMLCNIVASALPSPVGETMLKL